METSSPKPLDSKLRNQLVSYGLGAAAVAAAVAPTGSNAAVIFTNAGDVTGDSIYFDLQGGVVSNTAGTAGATDFHLYIGGTAGPKPAISTYTGTTNAVLSNVLPPIGNNYAPRLNAGNTIGSGNPFSLSAYLDRSIGQWALLGTRGFLGLRLDAGGGNSFYGWADISFNNLGGTNNAFILHGFAFDNVANETITIGGAAVPEGGPTALLLILGAAGVVGLRELRARRQAAA